MAFLVRNTDPDAGFSWPGYVLYMVNTTRVCSYYISNQCYASFGQDTCIAEALDRLLNDTQSFQWTPGAIAGVATAGVFAGQRRHPAGLSSSCGCGSSLLTQLRLCAGGNAADCCTCLSCIPAYSCKPSHACCSECSEVQAIIISTDPASTRAAPTAAHFHIGLLALPFNCPACDGFFLQHLPYLLCGLQLALWWWWLCCAACSASACCCAW